MWGSVVPQDKPPPDELHTRLGCERLSRAWAKVEIVFGLASAGLGMLLGIWSASRPAIALIWAGVALLLFVLGWYLALAGHRSHLYQSMNQATALLIEEMRRPKDKGHLS